MKGLRDPTPPETIGEAHRFRCFSDVLDRESDSGLWHDGDVVGQHLAESSRCRFGVCNQVVKLVSEPRPPRGMRNRSGGETTQPIDHGLRLRRSGRASVKIRGVFEKAIRSMGLLLADPVDVRINPLPCSPLEAGTS